MNNEMIRVAFMYDFDETLVKGMMQEASLFKKINVNNSSDFWLESNNFGKEHNADSACSYMFKLLDVAKKNGIDLTKKDFYESGKELKFFDGVETFFDRMNEYANSKGIELEHYVISTGNSEIIQGCKIFNKFKRVFACSYIFDENDRPVWISQVVNYTEKTQYIYRIRKNLLDDLYDSKKINEFVEDRDSLLPYVNMVYFGDGYTDVPSMKTITQKNGNSICVYTDKNYDNALNILKHGRVNFIAPADYSENSKIENICKNIIDKIALQNQK